MDTHLRASTATWGSARPRRRPSRPATPPERLGVYAVDYLLGEGGMARVYRGENTLVDRPVAIKRLLPELAHLPEAHALFLREARTASAIRHPHLLEVYDFGYDLDGRPYFVMELATGETLAQRLDAGPLPVAEAVRIAIALAEAVAAVHRAGYLHRDIKSDNVMLVDAEQGACVPKLIDFGIACRVDEGALPSPDGVAGTPTLMAPEQVAREPVGPQTDLWGLGVVLYEMLCGWLPFDDNLGIVCDPPYDLPDEVDPDLAVIVLSCLAKDPAERPRSASALAAALRHVARLPCAACPSPR